MKFPWQKIVPLFIFLICCCESYAPKLDTSSEESFWASKKQIEATLNQKDRIQFQKSARYIRALYTNLENTQIKGNIHQRVVSFMQFMHNKDAKDIIESADRLRKKYGDIKK